MPARSDAASLMEVLIGPGRGAGEAQAALEAALAAEVDPLHYCAIHLGLGETEIMQRVALWLGLGFAVDTDPRLPDELSPARLETLGEIRMLRFASSDMAYAAPDFFGALRLKRAARAGAVLDPRLTLVPAPVLRSLIVGAASDALIDGARQNLTRHWPHAAAQLDLPRALRWSFAAGLVTLLLLVLVGPFAGHTWLLPLWLALVVFPTLLRILALLLPAENESIDPRTQDADLPLYTILVPLRDEAHMVPQLRTALAALDYPADKLEILFVVESRSPETIAAVERLPADARFSLIVVPDAMPRTKPKALDFVLPLCHGEFLVVYDAEDRPEPAQLRRIVAQFRREPDAQCIQARLLIDNGRQGLLPALFTGEYAGLFTVMLPALARLGAIVPLGGTSNHFRLATLRALGGWDAYNVTEDADLGVRLARRGLRTTTSTSFTLESAPIGLRAWIGQRTRWMKGWMQTFMVHNRHPRQLLADLGWRGFALFQVVLLGMLLAPLLHVGFALVLVATFLRGVPFDFWRDPLDRHGDAGSGVGLWRRAHGQYRGAGTGRAGAFPARSGLGAAVLDACGLGHRARAGGVRASAISLVQDAASGRDGKASPAQFTTVLACSGGIAQAGNRNWVMAPFWL